MKNQEQEKNPQEYGYVGDELITMTAEDFISLRQALNASLSKETSLTYPEKYKYINRENGEAIKNVTDKNKAVALKIVDVSATLNSLPLVSRTPEGIRLLEMELVMGRIHIDMVESGVAKHKSFFEQTPAGEGVFAKLKENAKEIPDAPSIDNVPIMNVEPEVEATSIEENEK